jgi:uncharacterized protein YkwD
MFKSNQQHIIRYIVVIANLLLVVMSVHYVAKADEFGESAFRAVWERSDKAVAEGKATRTWLWGPQPNTSRREAYRNAPGGERLVQYFDKSRMEINNPGSDRNSRWYVTNGLLVMELVQGRVQLGDDNFQAGNPAAIPVGGDTNGAGPTYASFKELVGKRSSERTGAVGESINRAGAVGAEVSAVSRDLAKYTKFVPETGHNVPDVFWDWMQRLDENWLFAMGYPVTEPYWSKFTVGGIERELLVQLFERRALTYNPANAPEWQIEMGNIGQHYFTWRYGSPNGATQPPVSTTPGANPTQPPMPNPNGTPTPAPTTSPTPTPSPSVTPTPPTDGLPTVLNEQERKFATLVNDYRQQNNLPPLRVDLKLQSAARWHAEDMAAKNYFDHIDSQGRNYPRRFVEYGYTDTPVNENIAAGGDAQTAFDLWKNSAGYNAIMLNPDYKAIGIGYAVNQNSTYVYYWSTAFGAK